MKSKQGDSPHVLDVNGRRAYGHRPFSPEAARRITRLLLNIGVIYVGLVAMTLAIAWNLPRRTFPLGPMQEDLVFEAMVLHGGVLCLAGLATLILRCRHTVPLWLPRILIPCLLLGGLASVDRLVGLFFPPPLPSQTVFQLHPARGWTNRPNSLAPLGDTMTRMRIDYRGLRVDVRGGPEDLTGKKRMLFVGDSVTLGYSVAARDAWGWQTAVELNRRHADSRWAALNGGICGYDTRQERHWLTHEGFHLDPDLVVLEFCLNDLTRQYDPAFGHDQGRHPEFLWATPRTSWSGLRRAILELTTRFKFGDDLQGAAESIEHFALRELFMEAPPQHVEQAWNTTLTELKRFHDACKKEGVPMVLVCFPIGDQIELGSKLPPRPQGRLARFAAEQGMPFLDLLPVFRRAFGVGRPAVAAAFTDSTHPTPRGHHVAAEALATFLEESGLLRQGRKNAR